MPHSGILPRSGQSAVTLPGDKKILITGGVDGDNQLLGQTLFNPARIWSDKDDYQPDDPVILSGSGWKPNENVYLYAVDNETEAWTYESTVAADATGGFVVSPYFIVELRHLGVQFHVTALGAQSTMQADVDFTDNSSQITKIAFDRTGPATFISGAAASNGPLGVQLRNASNNSERLTVILQIILLRLAFRVAIPPVHLPRAAAVRLARGRLSKQSTRVPRPTRTSLISTIEILQQAL